MFGEESSWVEKYRAAKKAGKQKRQIVLRYFTRGTSHVHLGFKVIYGNKPSLKVPILIINYFFIGFAAVECAFPYDEDRNTQDFLFFMNLCMHQRT